MRDFFKQEERKGLAVLNPLAMRKEAAMTLTTLPLDQLNLSPLNVRKKGGKEIADLIPSIRSLGLIQPLLVRQCGDRYEIVAGQRRFHALSAIATEDGAAEPVPCIVMAEGDDAKAIEASLAENIARLPMDEIDQYKAFAALRDQGLDVAAIAHRFGVTERLVAQRLAIAAIIPPILNAYRREEIGADTLRVLTMATPRQQKAWWTLFKSEDEYAPTGRALKDWLFGGAQLPVSNALFDLADYSGAIVADLFGEERYFADADAFWTLQGKAIADKRETLLMKDGWLEVHVLEVGAHFATWEHRKTPRTKGGAVFIAITRDGEVTSHEGWISEKDARRKEKATKREEIVDRAESASPEQAGLTKPLRNYLGLHKHAAVRQELLSRPAIALRLAVAHMIAGSSLWNIKPEPQRAENEAIAASLSGAKASSSFKSEGEAVAPLMELEGDDGCVVRRSPFCGPDLGSVFQTLIGMDNETVSRILTFVMAETLEAHTDIVERLGVTFGTDMREWWTPDQTFFDLVREKNAVNDMLREVAGDVTADAHLASTAKVQKKIIADCLNGEGRAKVEEWLPRWMDFAADSDAIPMPVSEDEAVAVMHDSDIADAA